MTGLGFSCGACKFLRRKCTTHCVFAPHFSYDEASAHFSAVHKVFGASNVSKMLLQLPLQCRGDAAIAIAYEALARIYDPVYGCVSHIFALQQQIANLQEEIEILGTQMENIGFGNASCATFEGSKILNNGLNSSLQTDSENPNHHRSDLFPFLTNVEGSTADPMLNTHVDMNQQQLSPLFQFEDLFAIDKILQGLESEGLESDGFGYYNLGCLNLDDM